MGRKTWDSIPEKFRPLKGRLNVVLSRAHPPSESLETVASTSNPVRLPSLQSALYSSKNKDIGRLFVIGGAEIYKAALQERAAKRILLTRILSDFECDTFFPVQLGEDETGKWRKTSKEDLDLWVGEKVPEGIQDEHGVQYVFEMYERE